ncbi:E3 ubiquitin-protein ligase MIB2 [Strongylocentrotus purpuratus]|uniref:RING-type E3 ubiquitin transferase n=1 Tax=Strongylocentrotus purpuratus TaxID=7668 RepID=A0A7M7NXS5_STRPU|nr:E3 ubiquitin-protein ligase MIB2 [Strongylocentrotus purpuratus]
MAMGVGTRVVRGPDWKWSDQDDGEGHLGTVVTIGKGVSNPAHQKIVVVCWDMGKSADYRAGFDENYDLLIYDNAAAGVKHNGVTCDECKENDIAGMRWKCSSCYDYDLCNKCYMTSKHDLKHSFLRIIIPKSAGKLMSPRAACRKTEAKGSFPGAKVCRGRDWQWQQQDGGSGHNGVVIREANWANIQRSAIAVRWEAGGAYEYRVGHDGKVDIKCLKATSGYAYYKDHLPKFGEFNALEIGDRVVVKLDKDVLKPLQENHGGWVSGMEKFIGKVGRLASLTANSDVRIKYPNGQTLIFNAVAVTKLPSFNTGDKVRVMSDQAAVKELQKEHGGWNSKMSKALGEEGRVLNIDADGDVKVNVGGAFWTFNPEALSMVEQGTGAEGIFEQDIRAGVMAHLLKQLLDPLGLVDSDEIRQMMTAAATEAATKDGEVTAQSAKEFIKAVMEGDVKRVAEALKKNKGFVNVVVQDNTPLHLAAYQDHFQVVELLIKNGAKLDVKDDDGDTALANAVHQDNARIVKYLLDHGADPNTTNVKGGRSPLHIGASKNHTQCVRLILGKGGNPNVKDNVGDTPLHDAIRKTQKEITELLINARNIDLELNNKRGFNPLHHAALSDNPHATRLLIKKQRSLVDIRKDDGYAALHLAVHNGNQNIAEILITEGHCAIDLYNEQHQTPLLLAIAKGRTAIIEDLIKHGADINSSDGDGDSCLHIAVMKYRQGQDIPDTDNLRTFRKKYRDNGITKPLTALMCYLVQEGASISQTNLKKHTPLNYLKEAAIHKVLEHIARKLEREELGDSSLVHVEANDGGRERKPSTSSGGSSVDQRDNNDPSASPRSSLSDDSFCGVHIIKDPKNEVKLKEIIGKGGFGEVWKGQWRGTPVAVKLLNREGSQDSEVEQEVAIHKRALHPNIVQLMAVGHQRTPGCAMIVMQLIDGSNLGTVIFQDGNPYEFTLKVRLSRDLLSAVTFLHHCKILHLDIKPQNVIIESKTKKPYLCDLGLAHIKTRSTMSRATLVTARGTFTYMPPECGTSEDGNMSATSASDVWSLACTLLEFFSGQSVWPKTINPMALLCRFMGDDVMPANVEKLQPNIKKILKPCFHKVPSKRPSAESMMQQFSGLI